MVNVALLPGTYSIDMPLYVSASPSFKKLLSSGSLFRAHPEQDSIKPRSSAWTRIDEVVNRTNTRSFIVWMEEEKVIVLPSDLLFCFKKNRTAIQKKA
mmetsp:Transcript_11899/g.17343  ORF Transcript_11899/g.17343 Transcript_11899/m.17343 type:complete len:98 (-) Transcript_11899:148-441(-)